MVDKRLRQDYLVRELWILAWSASVQRARLYKEEPGPNSESIGLFRENLFSYLSSKVIPRYRDDRIEEEQHYRQIDDLVAYANSVGNKVLGQDGYKFGVAQKLLNLFLKYHWCLGNIAEPPHCPVDRIVIEKTAYKGKINWTRITQRSEYQKIMEDIKRQVATQSISIAIWELSIYSRRLGRDLKTSLDYPRE